MVSVAFIEKPGEQLFWVSALDGRGLWCVQSGGQLTPCILGICECLTPEHTAGDDVGQSTACLFKEQVPSLCHRTCKFTSISHEEEVRESDEWNIVFLFLKIYLFI